MKKTILNVLVFILYSTLCVAQDDNITKTIDFATLSASDPTQGSLFKKETLGEKDYILNITNVTKTKFKGYTVKLGGKLLSDEALATQWESDSVTMTLTTPILNLKKNAVFTIYDKAGKDVYSFYIEVKGNPDPPKDSECYSQGDFQVAANDWFEGYMSEHKKIKDKDNLYIQDTIDENKHHIKVVHLFIDHYGKYYGKERPTAVTEEYVYKIHVITSDCLAKKYYYSFNFTGSYHPAFNIEKHEKDNGGPQNSSTDNIKVLDFARFGPFTDEFTYEVSRTEINTKNKPEKIVKAEIEVPKLYHVSITAGLIATSIKNPTNIEISPLNATQNTLIADDTGFARGLLTVMAIYYPKGRSFLYPPKGGAYDESRLGIVIGTQLGKNVDENFLVGLTNDFARGGAVTYGVHFGRKTYVPGYEHFDFGNDVYDLTEVVTKKKWEIGLFIGVSIDTRVAFELLKSLTGSK